MKIWVICSGEAPVSRESRYDAAGYAAYRKALLEGEPPAEGVKAARGEGFLLYVSPHAAAQRSAALLYPELEAVTEPRLAELAPPRLRGSRPLWLWRLLTRPTDEDRAGAEALISELDEREKDCILVSHPRMIPLLLDRMRVHGHCVNRGEFGAIKPMERILVTRRDMHCGGCAHNCFLNNPGCGIGRDKAQRAGIPFEK